MRAPPRRAAACGLPISSARANSFSIASASSDWNTSTRARDSKRRVEFERRVFGGRADQHDGAVFHHRQEGILLRAIEAMHLVDEQQRALARSRGARAPHRTPSSDRRRRRTPRKSARTRSSVASASSRATVVLPVPGGPQKISEPSERASSMRVSAPSGPRMRSWPTTSASVRGRSLSASGRGASCSRPAAANSDAAVPAGAWRSSAERHGNLLPVAQHGDRARTAQARGVTALEVRGLGDLLVVDARG